MTFSFSELISASREERAQMYLDAGGRLPAGMKASTFGRELAELLARQTGIKPVWLEGSAEAQTGKV